MVAEGHTVASLTGGIEGSQRDAVIDAFRNGDAKVLITTNVLARGIDVSTVSLVINYVWYTFILKLIQADVLMLVFRTSPSPTPTVPVRATPTTRPTCTVSAVPVVSVVSALPSPSSPAARSGRCCARSSNISTVRLSVLTPTIGMKLRISSRRRLRTRVLKQTSSLLEDPALRSLTFSTTGSHWLAVCVYA